VGGQKSFDILITNFLLVRLAQMARLLAQAWL
jgi:hypothetical protein